MLEILIPGMECYDEEKNEFVSEGETRLLLEHSLYSIAKWESKWKKPFLGQREQDQKTVIEWLDYIRCMTLNEEPIPDSVYRSLSREDHEKINNYINDSMTAAWFKDDEKGSKSAEIVTADLVYYWLVASEIPFETQYWHFNRLMALVKICSIKNQPEKNMSKNDILKQNASINAARRAKAKMPRIHR